MVLFVYGTDPFLVQEKVKELKKKFLGKNIQNSLNVFYFSGKDLDWGDFSATLLSQGFLTEKRMLIVENFLSQKKNRQEMLALLKKDFSNIVLFVERIDNPSQKNPWGVKNELFSFLRKGPYVWELNVLEGEKLVSWVKKRAQKKGIALDKNVLEFLINQWGNDLWRIENELAKLSFYIKKKGDKKLVSQKDIEKISSPFFEEKVFAVVDALAHQKKALFLGLVERYLSEGAEPLFLLSLFIRQFRLLLLAQALLKDNPYANLSQELKIPFFLERKLKFQLSNYDFNLLKRTYKRLLRIDWQIKKGDLSPSFLFLELIK